MEGQEDRVCVGGGGGRGKTVAGFLSFGFWGAEGISGVDCRNFLKLGHWVLFSTLFVVFFLLQF